jgi:hypothetical protein
MQDLEKTDEFEPISMDEVNKSTLSKMSYRKVYFLSVSSSFIGFYSLVTMCLSLMAFRSAFWYSNGMYSIEELWVDIVVSVINFCLGLIVFLRLEIGYYVAWILGFAGLFIPIKGTIIGMLLLGCLFYSKRLFGPARFKHADIEIQRRVKKRLKI